MVKRVLQITENVLCQEHRNRKKTLSWSPRKICVLLRIAFDHSFVQNLFFFLTKVIFIQGAFKNNQGLLWRIQGLFKDIHQFFNFQGLFKACVNHGVGRRSGKINQ